MSDKRPLRPLLKNMLKEKTLSESQLDVLFNLESQPSDDKPLFRVKPLFTKPVVLWSSAASVLLCSILFFNALRYADMTQDRIVQEVLTNHLKIMSLDIESNSIQELRRYFDRLDFAPYLSEKIDSQQLKLVGGRYCTLQGRIASQLRFLDNDGQIVTYYQAHYDKSQFGSIPDTTQQETPYSVIEGGHNMTIWREKNIVIVLAAAAS